MCLDFSGPLLLVRSRGLAWPPLLASCCWWRRHHWRFWPFEYGRFSLSVKQKIVHAYIINKLIDNYYLFSYSKNTCCKALYIYAVFNNFFKKCNRNLTFKSFSYFPWTLWRNIENWQRWKKYTSINEDWIYFTFQKVFLCIHSLFRITTCTSSTFTNANNFKTDYVINNNVMICDLFCNDMWSILYIIMFWKALVWGFFGRC